VRKYLIHLNRKLAETEEKRMGPSLGGGFTDAQNGNEGWKGKIMRSGSEFYSDAGRERQKKISARHGKVVMEKGSGISKETPSLARMLGIYANCHREIKGDV